MRSRFAPSPTGYLHLGNVWTALLCWLQTRQAGGTLILRIEDIDEQRSKSVFAEAFMADMRRLGLDWDEGPDMGGSYGPYVQSKRYFMYEEALNRLKRDGLIYPCYCSRARLQRISSAPHEGEYHVYDGHCYGLSEKSRPEGKSPSLRLHVPDELITYTDSVYGAQAEDLSKECGDFIVRRADGLYAYQLAVSVDDGAMDITHVLRGRDLLESTERQILLRRLLGYENPITYTHVPLLKDSEGRRLSKRQKGLTLRELWDDGVESGQIIGYLLYCGGLIKERRACTAREFLQLVDFTQIGREDLIIDHSPAEVMKTFI